MAGNSLITPSNGLTLNYKLYGVGGVRAGIVVCASRNYDTPSFASVHRHVWFLIAWCSAVRAMSLLSTRWWHKSVIVHQYCVLLEHHATLEPRQDSRMPVEFVVSVHSWISYSACWRVVGDKSPALCPHNVVECVLELPRMSSFCSCEMASTVLTPTSENFVYLGQTRVRFLDMVECFQSQASLGSNTL